MKSSSFAFGTKDLAGKLAFVDKKLRSLLPENIDGVERLLQGHGKKLRPSLVLAIASYTHKKVDDSAISAAAAVELVHIASLVHDDIIDKGTLRWGVPTINSQEGANTALLAGDFLLAKGCSLAASISSEAGVVIAETIADLCEGQAQELNDQYNSERTIDSLQRAIQGKTSSLFIAACSLGGLVAGLDPEQINALSGFAESFGLAFQYMDDIADFTKSAINTGKSAQSDVQAGNYTLPVILSLQGPQKAALLKLLKSPDVSTEKVLKILDADKSTDKTLAEVRLYKTKARNSLVKIENPELKHWLENLIDSL